MDYKKILLLLITFINFSLFPIFATEENQNLSDSNLQPEEEAFEEESAKGNCRGRTPGRPVIDTLLFFYFWF